jgi:hypothetical protein
LYFLAGAGIALLPVTGKPTSLGDPNSTIYSKIMRFKMLLAHFVLASVFCCDAINYVSATSPEQAAQEFL